jgi:hypothetical protein
MLSRVVAATDASFCEGSMDLNNLDLERRLNMMDERQWFGLVFQICQCLLLLVVAGIMLFKL